MKDDLDRLSSKTSRSRALSSPSAVRSGQRAQLRKPSRGVLTAVEGHALRQSILNSDECDRQAIERLVDKLNDHDGAEATILLLESAFYFDNIGDASRAAHIACIGVNRASETSDLNLRRKAHNTAGIFLSRVCNFEQSCLHLEMALKLARDLRSPLFEFAVLCNVVSALQVMGLVSNAKDLAIKLTTYPQGSVELDYLHLQNAINGFRLASRVQDVSSMELFHSIALKKLGTCPCVDRVWKAYVEAQKTILYSERGLHDLAFRSIQDAVNLTTDKTNLRINVILYSAMASCQTVRIDRKISKRVSQILVELLEQAKSYALHREELLRAIVGLYENQRSSNGKKLGLSYLRQLNEHLINLKHRQFFDQLNRIVIDQGTSAAEVHPPTYSLPIALASIVAKDSCSKKGGATFAVSNLDCVQHKAVEYAPVSRRRIERSLRSEGFSVAEDWAVAADFATDRRGQHCFDVGRVAGVIALHSGFSEYDSVMVEMACRLHDIGKLAVDSDVQRAVILGKADEYGLMCDHALAGETLLGCSSDHVFQLAAKIARHHHEWWNGCGYPGSMTGEEIPLEARICLIADSYVTLLRPASVNLPWPEERAKQQLLSMAGVQLDPTLVNAFLNEVLAKGSLDQLNCTDVHFFACRSSLNQARTKLLNTVELFGQS